MRVRYVSATVAVVLAGCGGGRSASDAADALRAWFADQGGAELSNVECAAAEGARTFDCTADTRLLKQLPSSAPVAYRVRFDAEGDSAVEALGSP